MQLYIKAPESAFDVGGKDKTGVTPERYQSIEVTLHIGYTINCYQIFRSFYLLPRKLYLCSRKKATRGTACLSDFQPKHIN